MSKFIKLKASLLFSIVLTGCDQVAELPFGNGYAAKNICSGIFISDIEEHTLKNNYIAPAVQPLGLLWNIEIDRENNTVTSSDIIFNNIFAQQAYYRPGYGCTLLQDATTEDLDSQISYTPSVNALPSDQSWPHGSAGITTNIYNNIDYARIERAIDEAFTEPEEGMKQTVAVLVAHNNELIAERYARSVNETTRLTGWSMSKSFTATLIGMLQDRNLLHVTDNAPIAQWSDTEKENITIENLLHMASGLEYSEQSRGPNRDQSHMLHATSHFSEWVAAKPLIHAPGTQYNYSTGDTNILANIAQQSLGGTNADTIRFVQENLFDQVSITDPILEFDTSGNPVGGAYLMMKPRDWARLGLLYARGGDWFGQQVLSEDWIDYALTPSPANKEYAAHIWVNTDQQTWPQLPADTFAFMGFQQQRVFIIPSMNLVVVRMGYTFNTESNTEELVAEIIESIQS